MDRVTILVTGGAGFIGSCFIHSLRKTRPDYSIINVDKLTYAGDLRNLEGIEEGKNYHFVRGDITNRELMRYLFSAFRPRYVVNFAAESHVDRSIAGPEIFVHTNVLGTQVLLEAFRDYVGQGSHEARFLQVSTDEVYGALPLESEERFSENSPLRPNSPYAASKAAADLLVRSYWVTYRLPVLITRSSNNFGPRQYPEKLIPLMITHALEGQPLPVYGDGQNVRDWLYVEENCRAIDMVLHRGKPGEIYNIGGRNEWRNIDLVRLLCDLLAEETKREAEEYRKLITFVPDRPGHDRRYALNTEKIYRELGFQAQENFREALRHTVRWYIERHGKV